MTSLGDRFLAASDPDAYLAMQGIADESAADALLSDREAEVRRQVRDVVAAEVAPRARELDRSHAFAHESYQALARAGLGGLLFPRRWGGTADSHVAYAVAVEEIACACAATSLVYMTQMHAAYPIWRAGGDTLAARTIPMLLNGSAYGSLAITEPDAGSDVSSLKTRARARLVEGHTHHYVLSGSKTFITTGDRADVIVCFATIDPSRGRGGITAFVLTGDNPGLARGRPFEKMGMHGSSTAEIFLSDAIVPVGDRLGGEGGGWRLLMASVVKSRISAAAQGVGIARAAYLRTIAALDREFGGKLPADAMSSLAELRGEILQGQLLLLSIAREVDKEGQPLPGQIAIMKQSCTDLGTRVSVAAIGLLGAVGDHADIGVERCLRDAKVTQIYDGANEVQRLLIGRDTAARLGNVR